MMRHRVALAVLFIFLVGMLITACSSQQADSPSPEPGTSTTALSFGENVIYAGEGPEIIIIQDGERTVISSIDDYASKPLIAPDGQRLTYIAPFEFEMPGEVWLYDHTKRTTGKIATTSEFSSGKTPARLLWLDDQHILIGVMNQHGTIPSLRQLLVYSLADNSIEEKYQVKDKQHISDMKIMDTQLELEIETYDDNFMEVLKTDSAQVPLTEFLE